MSRDVLLRLVLEELFVLRADVAQIREVILGAHVERNQLASTRDKCTAYLEGARAQAREWIETLDVTQTPRVEVGPLPERCLEYDAEQCGRRNPDAIKRGGLGGPAREMCKGCGEDPRQE